MTSSTLCRLSLRSPPDLPAGLSPSRCWRPWWLATGRRLVWLLVVVGFFISSFSPTNNEAARSRSAPVLLLSPLPQAHGDGSEAEGWTRIDGGSYAGTSWPNPWRDLASAGLALSFPFLSCSNKFVLGGCGYPFAVPFLAMAVEKEWAEGTQPPCSVRKYVQAALDLLDGKVCSLLLSQHGGDMGRERSDAAQVWPSTQIADGRLQSSPAALPGAFSTSSRRPLDGRMAAHDFSSGPSGFVPGAGEEGCQSSPLKIGGVGGSDGVFSLSLRVLFAICRVYVVISISFVDFCVTCNRTAC